MLGALVGPFRRSFCSGFRLLLNFLRTSERPLTSAVIPFLTSAPLLVTTGVPPLPKSICTRLIAPPVDSPPHACHATARSTAAANSPVAPVRSSLPRPSLLGLLSSRGAHDRQATGRREPAHAKRARPGTTVRHGRTQPTHLSASRRLARILRAQLDEAIRLQMALRSVTVTWLQIECFRLVSVTNR